MRRGKLIAILIGSVLLIAMVIKFLSASHSTPERTLKDFYSEIEKGNYQNAYQFLSRDDRNAITEFDLMEYYSDVIRHIMNALTFRKPISADTVDSQTIVLYVETFAPSRYILYTVIASILDSLEVINPKRAHGGYEFAMLNTRLANAIVNPIREVIEDDSSIFEILYEFFTIREVKFVKEGGLWRIDGIRYPILARKLMDDIIEYRVYGHPDSARALTSKLRDMANETQDYDLQTEIWKSIMATSYADSIKVISFKSNQYDSVEVKLLNMGNQTVYGCSLSITPIGRTYGFISTLDVGVELFMTNPGIALLVFDRLVSSPDNKEIQEKDTATLFASEVKSESFYYTDLPHYMVENEPSQIAAYYVMLSPEEAIESFLLGEINRKLRRFQRAWGY